MSRVYFPSVPLKDNGQEYALNLLQLLLGAQVVGVAALGFAAIGSPRMEAGIAFATDHLVTVEFHGQDPQRGLNNTSTETKHQMESGL